MERYITPIIFILCLLTVGYYVNSAWSHYLVLQAIQQGYNPLEAGCVL